MIDPDKRNSRERPQRVLVINPRGMALHKPAIGRDLWSLRWNDVEEIVGFRVDRPAGLVCLGLKSEHELDYRIVDAESPGWNDVVGELERRFDSAIGRRLSDIVHPPFAENFTVLWSRVAHREYDGEASQLQADN